MPPGYIPLGGGGEQQQAPSPIGTQGKPYNPFGSQERIDWWNQNAPPGSWILTDKGPQRRRAPTPDQGVAAQTGLDFTGSDLEEPPAKPTQPNLLTAPFLGVARGVRELAQTPEAVAARVAGTAPPVPLEEEKLAEPASWGEMFGHPVTFAEKTLYGLGRSAPMLGAGVAAGVAGAAASGGDPLVGLITGSLGAAAGSMAQEVGPRFADELKSTPGDPNGAFNRAIEKAGTSGAISGIGWAAFGVAPFKSAFRNLMFQAFGIQPGVAVAGQVAENLVSGRPAGEGVAEAVPGAVAGTLIPAAGHAGVSAGAQWLRGRAQPGATPGAAPGTTPAPAGGAPGPAAPPAGTPAAAITQPRGMPAVGEPVTLNMPDIRGAITPRDMKITGYTTDGTVQLVDDAGRMHEMAVEDLVARRVTPQGAAPEKPAETVPPSAAPEARPPTQQDITAEKARKELEAVTAPGGPGEPALEAQVLEDEKSAAAPIAPTPEQQPSITIGGETFVRGGPRSAEEAAAAAGVRPPEPRPEPPPLVIEPRPAPEVPIEAPPPGIRPENPEKTPIEAPPAETVKPPAPEVPTPPEAPVQAPEISAGAPKIPGGEPQVIYNRHTKTGADLWTVQFPERVPPDEYQARLARAKAEGGRYSWYSKNGAIPGYVFTSPEAAQRFIEGERARAAPKATKPAEAPAPRPPVEPRWMNGYEIDEAAQRFANHPVLGKATRFLAAFRDQVDERSDGWPYWKAPGNAARQLMGLIARADPRNRNPIAPTEEEFQAALAPIRRFYTMIGEKNGMKWPETEKRRPAEEAAPRPPTPPAAAAAKLAPDEIQAARRLLMQRDMVDRANQAFDTERERLGIGKEELAAYQRWQMLGRGIEPTAEFKARAAELFRFGQEQARVDEALERQLPGASTAAIARLEKQLGGKSADEQRRLFEEWRGQVGESRLPEAPQAAAPTPRPPRAPTPQAPPLAGMTPLGVPEERPPSEVPAGPAVGAGPLGLYWDSEIGKPVPAPTPPRPPSLAPVPATAAAPEARPERPAYGSTNTMFTNEGREARRARLQARLRGETLTSGFDPELANDLFYFAGYHIEAGARQFAHFAREMVADLGEQVRPYLRGLYENARHWPGFEPIAKEMSSPAEIEHFLARPPETPTSPMEGAPGELRAPLPPGAPGSGPEDVHGAPEERPAGQPPAPEVPGGPRPEGAPPVGETAPEPGGGTGGGGAGVRDTDRVPEGGEAGVPGAAGRPPEPPGGARPPQGRAPDAKVKGTNFRIEPGALAEERSPRVKAADNLAAIELAKQITAEGRAATKEEQATLAKYVGWGGLSNAFPDPATGQFRPEFAEVGPRLRELLSDPEYKTAERSTQYAHYTAENVINAMWDAVRRMGFDGGMVFEPGMGVGHFLGLMPEDLAGKSRYQGIEMDHISADIAKLLYPESGVRKADFTRTPMPENVFDLVIGNPPFSRTEITSDPKYAAKKFLLHDYFFSKSLDSVRPGGLMALVTTAGAMNKLNDRARRYWAERADLVGGIRLPSGAFSRNAGTEVTTDILFFQKRPEQIQFGMGVTERPPRWTETVQRTLPDKNDTPTKGNVSRYFSEHPENVLGEEGFNDKLYEGRYAVQPRPDVDLAQAITEAVQRLPEGIMKPAPTPEDRAALDFSSAEKKDGSFYVGPEGRLMQFINGAGRPVERFGAGVKGGYTPDEMMRIRGMIPIRDALRDVFAGDLAGDTEKATTAREKLNKSYDEFVRKYGPLNKAVKSYSRPSIIQQETARNEARERARSASEIFEEGDFDPTEMIQAKAKTREIANARSLARVAAEKAGKPFDEGTFKPKDMPDVVHIKHLNAGRNGPFSDDQESYRLAAIEDYDPDLDTGAKRRIFFESILGSYAEPQIKSADDGILWSINQHGRLDIDAIAEKLGTSRNKVIEELGDKIMRLPPALERPQEQRAPLPPERITRGNHNARVNMLAGVKRGSFQVPSPERLSEAIEKAAEEIETKLRAAVAAGRPVTLHVGDETQTAATVDDQGRVLAEDGHPILRDFLFGAFGKDKDTHFEIGRRERAAPIEETRDEYQIRDAYLSGDVRSKLEEARAAAERDPSFRVNVEALEKAQPIPLSPAEIITTLGMPWVPQEVTDAFIRHLDIGRPEVRYSKVLGKWNVLDEGRGIGARHAEWSTADFRPGQLLDYALNGTSPKVVRRDKGPPPSSWTDEKATQEAQDKVEAMKEAFQDWVNSDPQRAAQLADVYNEQFNRVVLRNWAGDYLTTPGVASTWSWRPHQLRVVARIIQAGNTYINHAVGAGKTSEMIGAAMEMRRLGLVRKPMFVVPNHMLGQFAKEFYEQYPTARIKIADERNFRTDRRKQFIADVAGQDHDAVIITNSAFGRLPISPEFRDQLIGEEVDEIDQALHELGHNSLKTKGVDKGVAQEDRITVKKLQKQKEKLEQKLAGIGVRGDETNTFEETGIDFLFVDEAHQFRKLPFVTKATVKGIDSEGSDMSRDLYAKLRYLQTKNPARYAVFASGTPITNTMGELYSLSRYLQPEALAKQGLAHFDSWRQTFGATKTELEQTPQGTYEPATRFSRFVNIPELYKMVGAAMDTVTSNELGQYVKRPDVAGGKRELHIAPRTDYIRQQQEYLAQRVKAIRERRGPPQKGDDILLSVINDGRLLAIDPRLVNPDLSRDPDSKLSQLIDNVHRIWGETKNQQFYDPETGKELFKGPATQLVFANMGIHGAPGEFSVHKEMRAQWRKMGIPDNEIAFIDDAKTVVQKQRLFNDVNEGKVRILVGSTAKMGTGVNVQRRLAAIHNLDPLWFPADDEQRNGRGIRQGNLNKEIQIHDYSTEGTYDSSMWQMMGRKARFIEQFFRGDPTLREIDDLGEASQYEQASAMSTADPRVLVLTQARQDLQKLQRRAQAHEGAQYMARSEVATQTRDAASHARTRDLYDQAVARHEPIGGLSGKDFRMQVGGTEFKKHAEAAKALDELVKSAYPELPDKASMPIGEIGGFPISMMADMHTERDPKTGAISTVRDEKPTFYVHLWDSGRWGDEGIPWLRHVETGAGVINAAVREISMLPEKRESQEAWRIRNEERAATYQREIGRPFKDAERIPELRRQIKQLEDEISGKAPAASPPPEFFVPPRPETETERLERERAFAALPPAQEAAPSFAAAEEPRAGRIPESYVSPRDLLAEYQRDAPASARDWLLTRGRDTGNEHLTLTDPMTARVIGASTSGDVASVSLPEGVAAYGAIVEHNHPSSFALSPSDLTLLATRGLGGIVAYGHNGEAAYGAWLPENAADILGTDPLEAGQHLKVLSLVVQSAVDEPIAALIYKPTRGGALTMAPRGGRVMDEANLVYPDVQNRALAAAGFIHYVSTLDYRKLLGPVMAAAEKAYRGALAELQNRGLYQPPAGGFPSVLADQPARPVRPEERMGSVFEAAANAAAGRPGGSGRAGTREAYAELDRQRAELLAARAAAAPIAAEAREEPERFGPGEVVGDERDPARVVDAAVGEATRGVEDAFGPPRTPPPPGRTQRFLSFFGADRDQPGGRWFSAPERYVTAPLNAARYDLGGVSRQKMQAERAYQDRRATLLDKYTTGLKPYLDLPLDAQRRVIAVLELHRLQGIDTPLDGRAIIARNAVAYNPDIPAAHQPLARNSRPGDLIQLRTPAEIEGFAAYRRTMDGIYQDLIQATARRYGWDGPPRAAAIGEAARRALDANNITEARRLARVANIVGAIEYAQRTAYVPFMREGDYFFRVTPKAGTPDRGNVPGWDGKGAAPTVWYSRMESRLPEEKVSGRTVEGARQVAAQRDEIRRQFPEAEYDLAEGYHRPSADPLRELDTEAIETLFRHVGRDFRREWRGRIRDASDPDAERAAAAREQDLHDRAVDAFLDRFYTSMRAGFRQRAENVAGWEPDLLRTTGVYVGWLANHISEIENRDRLAAADRAVDEGPDKQARQYWHVYDRAMEGDGDTPFQRFGARARQAAFYWALGGNFASTVKIMLHAPMLGYPILSTGLNRAVVGKNYLGALNDTLKTIRGDVQRGITVDPARAARTDAERRLIAENEASGRLHAQGAEEFGAIREQGLEALTPQQQWHRRILRVWGSNIVAADRALRSGMLLAAYRSAQAPDAAPRINRVWDNDAVWRDSPLRRAQRANDATRADLRERGETGDALRQAETRKAQLDAELPARFAEFMVDRSVGVWGRANRAPVARTPVGAMMMQFRQYELNFLSTLHQATWHLGPAGKVSALMMLGGLGIMAGAVGLPLAKDIVDAYDWVHKLITGIDPDVEDKLLKLFSNDGLGLGDGVAHTLMYGIEPFGIDLGPSLSFGELASRNLESPLDLAGAAASIFLNSPVTAYRRLSAGQSPEAAFAELMPAPIKSLVRAFGVYPQEGVRTVTGHPVVLPSEISQADQAKQALGLRPASIGDVYREREQGFRMTEAHKQAGEALNRLIDGLYQSAVFADQQGDHDRAVRYRARAEQARQDAAPEVRASAASLRHAIREAINPRAAAIARAPKAVRPQLMGQQP